eukprot:TRINITY_DN3132_c0_g1_i3.p1 TRINITY_DN3132_c0_g1~~TRINITY_DN3132_c0_g1_i3.p1  ORF type:complete len:141 (-),score=12.31 TRINITY_DN3132_c0_g1_i3:354-776(-)
MTGFYLPQQPGSSLLSMRRHLPSHALGLCGEYRYLEQRPPCPLRYTLGVDGIPCHCISYLISLSLSPSLSLCVCVSVQMLTLSKFPFFSCGDLMFSGHTVHYILMALIWTTYYAGENKKRVLTAYWAVTLFGVSTLLSMR